MISDVVGKKLGWRRKAKWRQQLIESLGVLAVGRGGPCNAVYRGCHYVQIAAQAAVDHAGKLTLRCVLKLISLGLA